MAALRSLNDDLDERMTLLRRHLNDRDLYELTVLAALDHFPRETQDEQETRLLAYQRAMQEAPPRSTP